MTRRFSINDPRIPTFVVVLGLVSSAFGGDPPVTAQKPEPALFRNRGEQTVRGQSEVSGARKLLGRGARPSWIWGANPDARYQLRKGFIGAFRSGALRASADNHVTVRLNGQDVGSSDNWQEPLEADVSAKLVRGQNELVLEVGNEGGPSGCVFELALVGEDGKTTHVVSDGSWLAVENGKSAGAAAVKVHGALGSGPWGDVFAGPTLVSQSPRGVFEVPPGFKVERMFRVPRETHGSWVAIGFDDKGRLIASDQDDKGLFRVTLPPPGTSGETHVEPIKLNVSGAQGILHAFGRLYLSVNGGPGSGLYRASDTDGNDQYDTLEKLAEFRGGGEHGPHGIRLSPDGQSIYVVAGNHTLPPERIDASRVPRNWDEDQLLPRMWDANGHARGILAPGGWIARTDPDGKTCEMISIGYRNTYDIAFNADGELFGYDSDMEWDLGMPWYRPTRATHSVSGSDFGWRSGTGKWPAYYADSLPPLREIGPGSPVGVTFGYGAKFPAKYQKALYLCDWTFGTIRALHLEPSGSTYRCVEEEFVTRTPLPLTDATVGPDGAFYFTIGGRGTASELFRVTYEGPESTAPADAHDRAFADARATRHRLEALHRPAPQDREGVAFAYPYLGDPDRFLRAAARVALEHRDPKLWQDRVLSERDPQTLITGAVALARQGSKDLQPRLLAALGGLKFSTLPEPLQLELLRAYALTFIRMGPPDPAAAAKVARALDPAFPSQSDALNRELATILVYLKSPGISAKLTARMRQGQEATSTTSTELLARNPGYGSAVAQMQANRPEATNIWYAFVLRNLREGWSREDRAFYFHWLDKARGWSGGASYQGFLNNIDKEAYENASDTERLAIEAAGARAPYRAKELPKPRGPGREWTLGAIEAAASPRLSGRDFAAGQRAFAAARCVVCHRFAGDGGATGPDLTQAAGRFGVREVAEAILEPSKVVSDQYRATTIATTTGQVHTGRVVGESKTELTLLVDPEDSTRVVNIPRSEIDEMKPSPTSLMPAKLLDSLSQDEVLDLFAYLLSRGDANDPMFRKKP
jgi:putative heme-binding domain-containing protein